MSDTRAEAKKKWRNERGLSARDNAVDFAIRCGLRDGNPYLIADAERLPHVRDVAVVGDELVVATKSGTILQYDLSPVRHVLPDAHGWIGIAAARPNVNERVLLWGRSGGQGITAIGHRRFRTEPGKPDWDVDFASFEPVYWQRVPSRPVAEIPTTPTGHGKVIGRFLDAFRLAESAEGREPQVAAFRKWIAPYAVPLSDLPQPADWWGPYFSTEGVDIWFHRAVIGDELVGRPQVPNLTDLPRDEIGYRIPLTELRRAPNAASGSSRIQTLHQRCAEPI